MTKKERRAPKAVLIEDEALLAEIDRVRLGRRDNTCAKTMKDLLREKIAEIRVNGDPARVADLEQVA